MMAFDGLGSRIAARAGRVAPRRRKLIMIVTATVAVVVAAGSVVFWLLTARVSAAETQARDSAVAAARAEVQDVLSYDPVTLDADMQRARAAVTGPFAEQFDGLLGQLVQPAVQQGLTTTSTVNRSGVVSSNTAEVVVLLYLDQRSSKAGAPPTAKGSKALVTMRPVDGRWLIADLRAV